MRRLVRAWTPPLLRVGALVWFWTTFSPTGFA